MAEGLMQHSIKCWIGGAAVPLLDRMLPVPEVVSGAGSTGKMADIVKKLGVKKPLIVSDEILVQLGHVKRITDSLSSAGLSYAVYDKVLPNPHTGLVEDGEKIYRGEKCDGLIAVGGGSPMDCAKVIGARICNPQPITAYEGFGNATQFRFKLPPLVAVPTTAGTGSETTVAAVITLAKERRKMAIADQGIVPRVAVLDPQLLVGLPPPITAATGVDALTHAVESYVSTWANEKTKTYSLRAVERIFRHLKTCYDNGGDERARNEMLLASFEAGVAFTRAAVGYVHAVAHQLGGIYGTPHGLANAIVLPHVLDFYLAGGDAGRIELLAKLAVAAGLGSHYTPYTADEKLALARDFIAAVRQLNADMGIPVHVPKMLAADVKEIARRGIAECHGLNFVTDTGYPVPKQMTLPQCEEMVGKLVPPAAAKL